MEQHN